jgi:GNAT superfamily N-acetyltransferase
VVVAEWDGRAAGYARLEFLWSHIPYLGLVRVLPEYQRRGVGQAMLRYLEAHLCAQGHTRSTAHRRLMSRSPRHGIGAWGLQNAVSLRASTKVESVRYSFASCSLNNER